MLKYPFIPDASHAAHMCDGQQRRWVWVRDGGIGISVEMIGWLEDITDFRKAFANSFAC